MTQPVIVDASRLDPRLEIQVQNRVVILLGKVTSTQTRTTIRDLAWAMPGVHDVCNRLSVAPTGYRTGVEHRDDWS